MEATSVDVAMAEPMTFPALKNQDLSEGQHLRKVPIPPNRMTPLKANWLKIYSPLVEQLKLHVRFNPKTRTVEMKNSPQTTEMSSLQKGADFVRAFALGFEVEV